MAIQSAVAYSEAKDGGLLVSWQLMECVLVWVVPSSLAVEGGFLSFYFFFIMDKSFDFSVGRVQVTDSAGQDRASIPVSPAVGADALPLGH